MDILQGPSPSLPRASSPGGSKAGHFLTFFPSTTDNFPHLFHFYADYCTHYAPYLRSARRALLLFQSHFYRHVFPALYPLYAVCSRLLAALLTETPSLATLAVLAVLLVLSLKVLDLVRRTVIYWIGVALRLAMWASVALLGVYVYQRGVEESLEDVGWVIGLLVGLGEQGQQVGQARAAGRERDARRIPKGNPRGRTRGAGW
ncbi:MAG: hypothetical protein LQ342_001717 [Letrouitia transgressa]|nr:MAG: hypothetical protein LQ342_001717 [Letrouitia transgressa]